MTMNPDFKISEMTRQITYNIQLTYNLEEYRKASNEFFKKLTKATSYGQILEATNEFKISVDAIEAVIAVQKFT